MKIDIEGIKSFIPTDRINEDLARYANPERSRIEEIIVKSLAKNRLEPSETATFLNVRDPELRQAIFAGARELKERIYGNRIVPLPRSISETSASTTASIAVFAPPTPNACGTLFPCPDWKVRPELWSIRDISG